ncbi:MAG: glycosyltransferase family 2 protein [bacterium]|nr:glycosyltransferase family 2 protein [bacterium]
MHSHLVLAFLNYNTTPELLQALAALPAALANMPARVIVIDNASRDNPATLVQQKFPHVEWLQNNTNLGFAAAFNQLFARVPADWYLLLNSDIILPPASVPALLSYAQQYPNLGLAGVALVREDGSPQASYAPFPSLATELLNRSLYRHIHRRKAPHTTPFEVDTIVGAVMLVPRHTIERTGGFDPRFYFFMEETDWCRRIRNAGLHVFHFPQIRVTHLQGRAANQTPLRARIEFHRSRLLYFSLHHGRTAAAILCAGTVLRVLLNALTHVLLVLLTLGLIRKVRTKCVTYLGLLSWYLRGCPRSWGLAPQ